MRDAKGMGNERWDMRDERGSSDAGPHALSAAHVISAPCSRRRFRLSSSASLVSTASKGAFR